MASMFGKNVIPFAPVAPAEKIIDGATSNSTCDAYELEHTGAAFLTTARVGDLIVKWAGDNSESAYIRQVESDTKLLLDRDLEFDSDEYDLLRPGILDIRAPQGLEWILRSIRSKEGNYLHRVGLWYTDNSRQFLLLDTLQLYERLEYTNDGQRKTAQGFWMENQDLLIGWEHVIQVRNYRENCLEIVVYGVNKTVEAGG